MKRNIFISSLLFISILFVIILSISIGSVQIKPATILNCIFNTEKINDSSVIYIIKELRIPRCISSLLAGAILSLSGLVFQCVFKNPMADSYVLGISSGSSLFVSVLYILHISSFSFISVPICAFSGSMITALFLFYSNRNNIKELLLSGISINFLFSAVTTLLIQLSEKQLDQVYFWTMGSFSSSTYATIYIFSAFLLLLAVLLKNNAFSMDIMLLDDSSAISIGLNLKTKRLFLLLLASISTAIVVSFCGVIGFVGLMCPHIMRLLLGPKHSKLIGPCILSGALVMGIADLISKTVISPSEIPVGIITSIIGAPLFFLILKRKKSWIR